MSVVLQHVVPDLIISENIAIVGSSHILLEKEYGKEIDAFDEVIRFNRAPTKGWEKHVGSKTTIIVANQHVFSNVKHSGWDEAGQPQYFIKEQRNVNVILTSHVDMSDIWRDRNQHIHETSRAFLMECGPGIGKPTIGIRFIWCCVANNIMPHVYGFGLIEEGNKASHYWENKDVESVHHHYPTERNKISEWARRDLVEVHL